MTKKKIQDHKDRDQEQEQKYVQENEKNKKIKDKNKKKKQTSGLLEQRQTAGGIYDTYTYVL